MTVQIGIILGTRPEIIKLAPVIRECEREGVEYTLIHTGQHYSENLDTVFFDQLSLPNPDYNLRVGSKSQGAQTGEMIVGLEDILADENPETVLVQGDTNSVLAGGITTSKLEMDLGHVEAGLRSFDREMPEEMNRVLTDHAADYLFAPTSQAASLLRDEGIPDNRITVTGNTIVDAVNQHREMAETKSSILTTLQIESEDYILLTVHRESNVDCADRFSSILAGVAEFARLNTMPVIYPIHPRAKERVDESDITVPDIIDTVPPQDFLDFLSLESHASVVFTDSGGVQEETCILGTPCVTVRNSTERPETLEVGSNTLTGSDPDAIVEGGKEMLAQSGSWDNPFGDGQAAERIVDLVLK